MIENRLIICIASSWELDPTSKHHLMRILSRRNDVVWVSYHGSRRPRLSQSDRGSALHALRRIAAGVKPINERMVQLTPFVLPGAPGCLRALLNRRLMTGQLRRVVAKYRRHPDQPVQLWTFAPDVGYLAGAFGEECLVYYCVDEFRRFEGFCDRSIAAAEQQLIAAADVIITSAAELHKNRTALHPQVHLVRHGVDHAHFAQALRFTDAGGRNEAVPMSIRNIPTPRAGFIGLIQHWFDIKLVRNVARQMPEVSFVLVGECQTDVSALEKLNNVHFLGRQRYETLPAYCAAFDVGLIPFVRSPMTDNVNSIKLREYLAAGLPVVSASLPEVRPFAPDVLLADNATDFAAACRRAIDGANRLTRRERSASVADQSWEAVTERVSRLVLEAAHKRAGAAAPLTAPGVATMVGS